MDECGHAGLVQIDALHCTEVERGKKAGLLAGKRHFARQSDLLVKNCSLLFFLLLLVFLDFLCCAIIQAEFWLDQGKLPFLVLVDI